MHTYYGTTGTHCSIAGTQRSSIAGHRAWNEHLAFQAGEAALL